ncbi:hypothetical protein [Vibrio owensii]|uniref:hypothetical protein n=1 Tax=Vibrio owensii TaxID=696485 RepID=UPI003CC5AEE9
MTTINHPISNSKLLGLLAEVFSSDSVFGFNLYCKFEAASSSSSLSDNPVFVQLTEEFEDWSYSEVLDFIKDMSVIGHQYADKALRALRILHLSCSPSSPELIKSFEDVMAGIYEDIKGSIVSTFFSSDSIGELRLSDVLLEFDKGLNGKESLLEMAEMYEYETFESIDSIVQATYQALVEFVMLVIQAAPAGLEDEKLKSKFILGQISRFDFIEAVFCREAELALLENKGCSCPVCESQTIEMMSKNADESGIKTENSCSRCETQWSEIYTLSSISDISDGESELACESEKSANSYLMDTDAVRCFKCKSDDLDSAEISVEIGTADTDTHCASCDSSWHESYTLTKVKMG